MIVAIVMQTIATVIALLLVNETKYCVLWICCIIGLSMLSTERVLQLLSFDGIYISKLTYAWIGIIVSLCFSIGVVFARFLVNHVDRMALERRLLENRFMTAVIRTEERSRASFSRELHDGLGPLLSSAKMSLSALSKAELNERDRQTLQNTTSVIDEAIRSLREISNNLSPHVLNNFGLERGIKNFVERTQAIHSTEIFFTTNLRDERFDSNIEVIIYRVVCELINNSLKHAACSKIEVSLMLTAERITLEYGDNGRGFTPSEVEGGGMGLANIKSRISSLDGIFNLDSHPGEGMHAKAIISTNGTKPRLTDNNNSKYRNRRYERKHKDSACR